MPAEEPVEISDECELLRRINPIHIVPDGNTGRRRLSSGAFRDRAMSVDAECLIEAAGLDWSYALRGYVNFFLVRFSAAFARRQQQAVDHVPLDATPTHPGNPFHAEVSGRKSEPICNSFRTNARWVVAPSDV